MAHDPGRRRFFAYLNLFVAAMLLLVLGNNFVALYVGWEGVGLASYLLIAFWYTAPGGGHRGQEGVHHEPGRRRRPGPRDLPDVRPARDDVLRRRLRRGRHPGRRHRSPRSGLLLLLGACGKSGQFPLQAWLPDAMEGPTPVSALIHAATMVTAGVYLIARCAPDLRRDADRAHRRPRRRRGHPADRGDRRLRVRRHQEGAGLLDGQPDRLHVPRRRPRPGRLRRRASRTCYAHGFFKAGLFLGAGSVMHAMNDQVDMRRFGGLWKKHADHLRDLRASATSR